MDKQAKGNQQAESQLKFYWLGLIVLAGLWLISFIFGSFVSPLRSLVLRLSLNGLGVVYFLSIYFYQKRPSKKETQNEIIIWFNGREIEIK
jgi:hypothetical protein